MISIIIILKKIWWYGEGGGRRVQDGFSFKNKKKLKKKILSHKLKRMFIYLFGQATQFVGL